MPSIRKRGDRWMVIYRDGAGVQRSAGSFKSETEARKVLRRTVDNATQVKPLKTYSTKALGSYAPTWLAGHQLEASSPKNYQGSLSTNRCVLGSGQSVKVPLSRLQPSEQPRKGSDTDFHGKLAKNAERER